MPVDRLTTLRPSPCGANRRVGSSRRNRPRWRRAASESGVISQIEIVGIAFRGVLLDLERRLACPASDMTRWNRRCQNISRPRTAAWTASRTQTPDRRCGRTIVGNATARSRWWPAPPAASRLWNKTPEPPASPRRPDAARPVPVFTRRTRAVRWAANARGSARNVGVGVSLVPISDDVQSDRGHANRMSAHAARRPHRAFARGGAAARRRCRNRLDEADPRPPTGRTCRPHGDQRADGAAGQRQVARFHDRRAKLRRPALRVRRLGSATSGQAARSATASPCRLPRCGSARDDQHLEQRRRHVRDRIDLALTRADAVEFFDPNGMTRGRWSGSRHHSTSSSCARQYAGGSGLRPACWPTSWRG